MVGTLSPPSSSPRATGRAPELPPTELPPPPSPSPEGDARRSPIVAVGSGFFVSPHGGIGAGLRSRTWTGYYRRVPQRGVASAQVMAQGCGCCTTGFMRVVLAQDLTAVCHSWSGKIRPWAEWTMGGAGYGWPPLPWLLAGGGGAPIVGARPVLFSSGMHLVQRLVADPFGLVVVALRVT